MANDTRDFDIVIFGATGYTGMYVVEELANSSKNSNLKWAVAGRNIEKLQSALNQVQEYLTGIDILNIPKIKADIYDQKSILEMCKKTRVVLNCVGPYKLYGEPVILACLEARTHHLDLSGEFEYLELSQAYHFHEAKRKGIYIVQACGFDSIPGDYGISLMKNKFPGELNSVEYYIEAEQGPLGRKTNIGTFVSAVGSIGDFFNIPTYNKTLHEMVFKKDERTENKYKLRWRLPPLFFSDVVKGWCIWFLGPDDRVIYRSQLFREQFLNERPIQSHGYVKLSLLAAFYLMFFGTIVSFLSFFSFGRSLLAKYPGFFTLGQFSKDGPTREQVEGCKTKFTFVGEGWRFNFTKPTDYSIKPDTKMKLIMTGPEAAYPLTAMCMVQAGLVVLEERDKMPLEGGVLTPGVAFERTTLKDRLEQRGMKFVFENM